MTSVAMLCCLLSILGATASSSDVAPGPTDAPSAPASGQPVTQARDASSQAAHTRQGFYLRMHAGYSYARTSQGILTNAELAPTINVAVGGAIVPNLILYGELLMAGALKVMESIDGVHAHLGQEFAALGLGPGVAYTYAPFNLYVSGTVALTKITFLTAGHTMFGDNPIADTDVGYAGTFTIGKEWWMSRNWSTGIAGLFSFGSMRHPGTYETVQLHLTMVSLLFSATYY